MNVWKVAFFTLSGSIVLLLAFVIYWATSSVETAIPSPKETSLKPQIVSYMLKRQRKILKKWPLNI